MVYVKEFATTTAVVTSCFLVLPRTLPSLPSLTENGSLKFWVRGVYDIFIYLPNIGTETAPIKMYKKKRETIVEMKEGGSRLIFLIYRDSSLLFYSASTREDQRRRPLL